ncbi:MAG TPA: DUF3999 family protein [Pyrinomonadaceae bacterium]|nr:DUF3999 family protein [Pyrinomonadaceae bacterium]
MKRRAFILSIAIVAALPGVAVIAQSALSSWPFFVEVTPVAAGLNQFAVPLHVLDKAGANLGDLRLYDANSREIPYAVLIRAGEDDAEEVNGTLFNQANIGSTAREVSVDLGEDPGEHNEVEIETEGMNFRRSVEVEGGDTATGWKTLTTSGVIFSFGAANSTARSNRVSYPVSRYRYLRVRVSADKPREEQSPVITSVKVLMSRREKSEITNWEVSVPQPQLLRHNSAPASSWTLDLGARVPCDRLLLTVHDESFSRPFEVEVVDDPNNIRLVASGELTRRRGEQKPATITFNDEVYARKLRLIVTDHSNRSLSIFAVEAGAPLRQLFFELKEPSAQPLRLYFGNANATEPHYDFEDELQSRLTAPVAATAAGPLTNNPDYRPAPLPFTERVPWLIYIVLTASSVVLGLILFSLARNARNYEQANAQPDP